MISLMLCCVVVSRKEKPKLPREFNSSTFVSLVAINFTDAITEAVESIIVSVCYA